MESRQLLIKRVSVKAIQADIEALVGRDVQVRIIRDRRTGTSRGMATLTFASREKAEHGLINFNGSRILGESIIVCKCFPRVTPRPTIRETLFDTLDENQRSKMQLDDIAEFSVTPLSVAARIVGIIAASTNSDLSTKCIVDGTSCVGGNTKAFADVFKHTVGIEIDHVRFEMLQHNLVDVLAMDSTQLRLVEGNFMQLLDEEYIKNADYFFLDPPWGGPDYKRHTNLQLSLGDLTIPEICATLSKSKCSSVVLKLPNNYAFSSLVDTQMQSLFPQVLWCRFPTMSIVILNRTCSHEEFEANAHRIPLDLDSAVYTRIYVKNGWKPILPKSLKKYYKPTIKRSPHPTSADSPLKKQHK